MKKIKVGTLFSGIGAPEWALKRLSYPHETLLACDNGDVDISKKIDAKTEREKVATMSNFEEEKKYVDELYEKNSSKHNFVKDSYLANYPEFDESNYFKDVTLLNGKPLKGKIDLLIGGSPCQSFSTVGFQAGLNDARGNLFFEFVRLVDEIKPSVFIYENVTGIRSKKNSENWAKMWKVMEELGYELWCEGLNAKDYGIPQIRNRIFVVGFRDKGYLPKNKNEFAPKQIINGLTMQDFLIESTKFGGVGYDSNGALTFSKEPGVIESKYYLTPAVKRYVLKDGTKNWHTKIETDRSIARTLLSTMGNHHRAGVDNYVTINGELRSLSERECLRLMGFTDDFKIVVSKAQMYKQAGNSMVVDVVMALLKSIKNTGVFD